jgi:hypothetical protein
MVMNSVWFAFGGRCCRLDLSSEPLEVLEQLTSSDVGQHYSVTHNSTYFQRLVPDGLIKTDVCERYDDIAVYEGGTNDLTRKHFSFVKVHLPAGASVADFQPYQFSYGRYALTDRMLV